MTQCKAITIIPKKIFFHAFRTDEITKKSFIHMENKHLSISDWVRVNCAGPGHHCKVCVIGHFWPLSLEPAPLLLKKQEWLVTLCLLLFSQTLLLCYLLKEHNS